MTIKNIHALWPGNSTYWNLSKNIYIYIYRKSCIPKYINCASFYGSGKIEERCTSMDKRLSKS